MNAKMYERMLRLYPEEFREEFGAEMAAVFDDALRDAHRRGMLAVARLWWREVVLLPRSLFGAGAPYHWNSHLVALISFVLLLATGIGAAHLITTAGFFNVAPLAALGVGLAASGFVFGVAVAGRRPRLLVCSIALAAASLLGSIGVDRALLKAAPRGHTTSVQIPGVRTDASNVVDAKTYHALVESARASKTNRLRISTHTDDSATRVAVVRTGGVDGAYMLLVMLTLAATGSGGWRLCRST